MKRDPVLLALLAIFVAFLAYKWIGYNPKVDYCYMENCVVIGHRPWAHNRILCACPKDAYECFKFGKNIGCPIELH